MDSDPVNFLFKRGKKASERLYRKEQMSGMRDFCSFQKLIFCYLTFTSIYITFEENCFTFPNN